MKPINLQIMNERLKDFLSARGSSVFAALAWVTFIVGGTAFAILTLILAITFELIAQVRNRVSSFI